MTEGVGEARPPSALGVQATLAAGLCVAGSERLRKESIFSLVLNRIAELSLYTWTINLGRPLVGVG